MPTYSAPDGTRLAYRYLGDGDGDPVICVPGGPTDSRYLGDLGGLSGHRRLAVPDLRGTGRSATPDDPATYRCDRLVDDVEALRVHLGLDRIDLLGHSASANIATQYAARHPHRLRRLALIGPSTRAVGLDVTGESRRQAARLRKDEPWFPAAFAALEAIIEGTGTDWDAISPFFYGRWDAMSRQHHEDSQPANREAVTRFGMEGAFDPPATRTALAELTVPVLLLTGEFDLNSPPEVIAAFAELFPDARLAVQPGAGHYPWLDDPERFTAVAADFLARP